MGLNHRESKFERIRLDTISAEERRFAVAYPTDPDPELIASIREWGLFLPLTVHEFSPNRYRVVAGNRRFPAARSAGLTSVPAHVLDGSVKDRSLFLLNLSENASTRSLNDLERGLALKRLLSEFGLPEPDLLQVMPLLGLEPGKRVLGEYLRLDALNAGLRAYVVGQGIPIWVSSRIAAWDAEDQDALLGLVRALKLGRNHLKEVLDLLEEIALRDGIGIAHLLAGKEVGEVLEESRLTPTQRRDRLKRRLTQMRFPQLLAQTQEVSRLLKKAGPPGGVLLQPPRDLEGNTLQASFSFGSIKELEQRIEKISSMTSSPEVRTVLSMLRQEDKK